MTVTKTCQLCGNTFTAKRTDARFCSASCRSRARRGTHEVVLAMRVNDTKAAITALADIAAELPVHRWAEVWRHIAQHIRLEIKRIGAEKERS